MEFPEPYHSLPSSQWRKAMKAAPNSYATKMVRAWLRGRHKPNIQYFESGGLLPDGRTDRKIMRSERNAKLNELLKWLAGPAECESDRESTLEPPKRSDGDAIGRSSKVGSRSTKAIQLPSQLRDGNRNAGVSGNASGPTP